MKIYTFSIVYNSFESYADKVPYVVAVVEDSDGRRHSAYIENYEENRPVKVGMDVEQMGVAEDGYLVCRFK